MKLSDASTIEILEYALNRERETRDFYAECLGKAQASGTKEILRGLVADEERHYIIVTELLDRARDQSSADGVSTDDSGDAKSRLTRALGHAVVDNDFEADRASVRSMLEVALANEKESFTNYARAATDASEDDTKKIFESLAREENNHFLLIDNLMSYLDDPGTWLYEEENLIFQR